MLPQHTTMTAPALKTVDSCETATSSRAHPRSNAPRSRLPTHEHDRGRWFAAWRASWVAILAALLLGFPGLLVSGAAMAQSSAFASDTSSSGTEAAATESTAVLQTLIDVLENPQSRDALLEALKREAIAADDSVVTDAPTAERVSPARRLAILTADIAEISVRESRQLLVTVQESLAALVTADWRVFGQILFVFLGLAAAVIVAYWLLRRLGRLAARKLDDWAGRSETPTGSVVRVIIAVIAIGVVDLTLLLAAWLGGFGLALFAFGQRGEVLTHESLFLNAFLLIELVKIVLRMLFVGQYRNLRLLPIDGEEAAYWNAWLARMVSLIGYGMLLVVPLINMTVSFAAGRSVGLIVMLTAFSLALTVVLQNRKRVCKKLAGIAEQADIAFTRFLFSTLSRTWHWIALIYFAALAIVTVLRPEDALPFMVSATASTVGSIVVGLLLATLLSKAISRGIRLPNDTRAKFPLLENRLNAYVPNALKIMRLLILLFVLAVIVDAWTPFSLAAWMASDAGLYLISATISVALILAIAAAIWLVAASWIEYRLNPITGSGEVSARERTLLTLLRNAIAIALLVITFMIVLSEIGVNIGPLLAGAGVLGLAIGFGAQTLVKDVITGLFIQLENAINVGDVVSLGGITGTAEKITIRSIGLRDLSGTYHIIPFSAVDRVANFNRDFAYHVGEYGIAYREDPDEAIVRMHEAFDELKANPNHGPKIIAPLEVHGVTALADSAVNVRVRIKVLPGAQFAVGREYNRLIKKHFDAAGIEIPYPHQTIYFGEDKDGAAPPARLQMVYRRAIDNRDGRGRFSGDPRAQQNPTERGDFDED